MQFIIGKKIGMTRLYNNGRVIPVTLIDVPKNTVSHIKTHSKDGYNAIQIAISEKKNISKPIKGHLAKAKLESALKIKEFSISQPDEQYQIGQGITINNFKVGDKVKISATSKGKGFTGTVKRYGFKIGPMSHGSNNHREPGSIGPVTPAHVIKGKRMPGRLGGNKKTIKDIEIVDVLDKEQIIILRGSIPGPKGSICYISK